MTLNNDALIKKDRLRFTKNKLSANLTLLAIVFDALYFVSIYKSDVGTYFYNWLIGVSIVYNLLFMLAAFLCEEGVKGYKMGYSYVLILLGLGQLVRILIIPMQAKNAEVAIGGENVVAMDNVQFIYVSVCLIASAALCIIAGIVGIIKTSTLRSYEAELEKRNRSGGKS